MPRTPGKKPGARKKAEKTKAKKSASRKAKKTAKAKAKKATRVVKPPSARRQKKPYAESEVARVRVPPANASREAMRFHAGKDYVYDPNQQTARWWWEAHYQTVPWDTFRTWMTNDEWAKRREEHWRTVEAALGRKIASDVVREQANEVKQLAKLRGEAFSHLEPVLNEKGEEVLMLAPKSYEGAVKAAIDLDKRLDEKRTIVTDQLPLALGSQTTEAQMAGPGVTYSDDELRAMAQARMRVQQKQLEAQVSERAGRVEEE